MNITILPTIEDFDYEKFRLFAIEEDRLIKYKIEHESLLFRSLLQSCKFASDNQAVRLSLADSIPDIGIFLFELISTVMSLQMTNDILGREVYTREQTRVFRGKRSLFCRSHFKQLERLTHWDDYPALSSLGPVWMTINFREGITSFSGVEVLKAVWTTLRFDGCDEDIAQEVLMYIIKDGGDNSSLLLRERFIAIAQELRITALSKSEGDILNEIPTLNALIAEMKRLQSFH